MHLPSISLSLHTSRVKFILFMIRVNLLLSFLIITSLTKKRPTLTRKSSYEMFCLGVLLFDVGMVRVPVICLTVELFA